MAKVIIPDPKKIRLPESTLAVSPEAQERVSFAPVVVAEQAPANAPTAEPVTAPAAAPSVGVDTFTPGELDSIASQPLPEIPADDATIAEGQAKYQVSPLNSGELAVNAAKAERNNILQKLFDERRTALQQQRTNDIRLAQFNALGNALRAMAQPIGWAAGGATAPVQKYDNRQYLEAFNRAVKAGDDLRNLGSTELNYRLNYADRDVMRAEKAQEYRRRKDESEAAYARRLDEKLKIAEAKNEEERKARKWDIIIRGFLQENNSNVRLKRETISLSEYLKRLDGVEKHYLGVDGLSDDELDKVGNDVIAGVAADDGSLAPESVKGNQGGAKTTNQSQVVGQQPPKPAPAASSGLTKEERDIIKKWSKYDTNKDGVIDRNERKVAKSNGKEISRGDAKSYGAAKKKQGAGKKAAPGSEQDQLNKILGK